MNAETQRLIELKPNPVTNRVVGTFTVNNKIEWDHNVGDRFILTRWDRTIYITACRDFKIAIDEVLGEKLENGLEYLVVRV